MVTVICVSVVLAVAAVDRFLLLRKIQSLSAERSSLLGRLTKCGAEYQELASSMLSRARSPRAMPSFGAGRAEA